MYSQSHGCCDASTAAIVTAAATKTGSVSAAGFPKQYAGWYAHGAAAKRSADASYEANRQTRTRKR